jgi:hypothetical protein
MPLTMTLVAFGRESHDGLPCCQLKISGENLNMSKKKKEQ